MMLLSLRETLGGGASSSSVEEDVSVRTSSPGAFVDTISLASSLLHACGSRDHLPAACSVFNVTPLNWQ